MCTVVPVLLCDADTPLSSQYMLGDDMLIAPVVSPANASIGLASKTVWLPEGAWVDECLGGLYTSDGTLTVTRNVDLSEIPIFVKAGAVIPIRPPSLSYGCTVPKASPFPFTWLFVAF